MNKMKLDIVLRTHDGANVHNDWRKRYFPGSKQELLLGCLNSLIKSIQNVPETYQIKLIVLDDNSTLDTVEKISKLIMPVKGELIKLEKKGYNNSEYEQLLKCRDTDSDLFYAVEDDYLHVSSAIHEMIETYKIAKSKTEGKHIVLYPFDTPEDYNPPKEQSYIVYGSNRHWKTGSYTTGVLFSTPQLLRDHWKLFETLALKYNGNYLKERTEHFEESNTIWKIWKEENKALRFSPIPSLALHMQFNEQIDPFIDWKQWWYKYANN